MASGACAGACSQHEQASSNIATKSRRLATKLQIARNEINQNQANKMNSKRFERVNLIRRLQTSEQPEEVDTNCSRLTPNCIVDEPSARLINPKFKVNSKPSKLTISGASCRITSPNNYIISAHNLETSRTSMKFKRHNHYQENGTTNPCRTSQIGTIFSLILLSIIGLQTGLAEGYFQQSTNAPMGQVVEGKLSWIICEQLCKKRFSESQLVDNEKCACCTRFWCYLVSWSRAAANDQIVTWFNDRASVRVGHWCVCVCVCW